MFIGWQTPFTKPSNSKVPPSWRSWQESLAKGLDVAFQGWDRESFIRCLSFSHVLKKGQHAAVMDLRVGGFLRLLQVAQLLKFWGNIHVCVKSEEIWEIEKDVLKRPCLTLLYKSLLCDLMIFLTPVHIQNKNTALYTWFDFMVIFYFVPVYPTIPKYHSLDPGTWPADGSTSEIILRGARKK